MNPTRFHLYYDGGLCEHSLNVCKVGFRSAFFVDKLIPAFLLTKRGMPS